MGRDSERSKLSKKGRKSTSNLGSKCLTPNISHVQVDYRTRTIIKKNQFFIKNSDKGPSITILSIQKIQNP